MSKFSESISHRLSVEHKGGVRLRLKVILEEMEDEESRKDLEVALADESISHNLIARTLTEDMEIPVGANSVANYRRAKYPDKFPAINSRATSKQVV